MIATDWVTGGCLKWCLMYSRTSAVRRRTAFLGYVLPFGQMSLWGKTIDFARTLSNFKYKPNKKFMAMFVGFVDGDGYFDIGEQKQYNKNTLAKSTIRIRLSMNVHVRDLSLLEYFVKTLGVGKIDIMSGERNQIRVIFYKKDLLTVIFPLMKEYDLKFLTYQRAKQFALMNYILKNSITYWIDVNFKVFMFDFKKLGVEDLIKLDYFADWLVGFTMAEGSFGMALLSINLDNQEMKMLIY